MDEIGQMDFETNGVYNPSSSSPYGVYETGLLDDWPTWWSFRLLNKWLNMRDDRLCIYLPHFILLHVATKNNANLPTRRIVSLKLCVSV